MLFIGTGHILISTKKMQKQEQQAVSNLYKQGRICNNSEIDTLISKRLSVENKAKLSQLETQNTSSAVLSILQFPVERVSLCSL